MLIKDKTVYDHYQNDTQPAVKLIFDDKEEAELVFNSIQTVLVHYECHGNSDEDNEKILTLLKRYYKECDTYEDNKPSTMVFSHMFKNFIWAFVKLSLYFERSQYKD